MNISAISSVNCTAKANASFKAEPKHEVKPLYHVTDEMPDDYVVGYSDWGGMAIPITAGQIRRNIEETKAELRAAAAQREYVPQDEESPEAYYKRKLFQSDWFM